ncbi:unnamed protein product [Ectocarpus fasciculatus]
MAYKKTRQPGIKVRMIDERSKGNTTAGHRSPLTYSMNITKKRNYFKHVECISLSLSLPPHTLPTRPYLVEQGRSRFAVLTIAPFQNHLAPSVDPKSPNHKHPLSPHHITTVTTVPLPFSTPTTL